MRTSVKYNLWREPAFGSLITFFSPKRRKARKVFGHICEIIYEFAGEFLTLPSEIDIVPTFDKRYKISGSFWDTPNDTDYGMITINLRPLLNLNNTTKANIFITFAHELIHAEQLALGKSKRTRDGKYVWSENGVTREYGILKVASLIKEYNSLLDESKMNEAKVKYDEYYNLPWEKEAFARQEDIAEKILNAFNDKYKVLDEKELTNG